MRGLIPPWILSLPWAEKEWLVVWEKRRLLQYVIRWVMLVVFISLNAHAQLRNAVEEEQVQQSDVVPSEYSRRQETPARRLTTYEYSRLMQTHVYQPEPEPGQFGGVVYLGDGEWRLCDRAPEPSSLSLLLAGGAVLAAARRRRLV